MGIDYDISGTCEGCKQDSCEGCKQDYCDVFSWQPRITYNHTWMYRWFIHDISPMKKSKTLKELLDFLTDLIEYFPATDINCDEGSYYKPTYKNASIGLNLLFVWVYCNYKRHPNAEVSIRY